jgi:hypothetical protein
VKPNKESQALVFTKPPADHDEKGSNSSFKEKDSREISRDVSEKVSKTSTPVDSQVVPEKNEDIDGEDVIRVSDVVVDDDKIIDGQESQVPVSAV